MTSSPSPRSPRIPILQSIAPLASSADAWLSDIWGVVHNGRTAFPAAADACMRFRQAGGIVVLVTNAPRPQAAVAEMLDRLGVPRAAWDAIVTSGDVTRELIRPLASRPIFHLGPPRDLGIFDGLGARFAAADAADAVVCTGLFDDDQETPEDYRAMLEGFRTRALPMICANPDIMVERGERMVYCAGAIAELYEALGGTVAYAGKPHAPIYERAFGLFAEIAGRPIPRERILAIGDGLKTDIKGAADAGLRSVFIASALHVEAGRPLDEALLDQLFAGQPNPPIAALPALAW
jgi:HAD superfamily hydrolase (TIGR01459 family)